MTQEPKTKLITTAFKFNCPTATGKTGSCAKMSTQHELLTHLQKAHKTSVTQYYCGFGDRTHIKFCDKSIVAVVIPKNGSLELFLVVKMRIKSGSNGNDDAGDICWIWHVGDRPNANSYYVKMDCNKLKWRGNATSLECSVNEVIQTGKYASFEANLTSLSVEIM